MKQIKAGEKTISLYDSIKEIPITRYKLLQQYMIQESGIGSSISDIDYHLAKTIDFLAAGKMDEAREELTNMRYNMFSVLSGLSFKTKAFCCLVSNMEPDEAAGIIELLPVGEVEEIWDSIKKKLIRNYQPIIPDGSELTLSTLRT